MKFAPGYLRRLAAKGYVYLNLDDTWASEGRGSSGELVPDPIKFSTPMPVLIEHVHSLGLRFGIYTDVGWETCAKRPGSEGHETADAELFAAWKVDFVKSDSCFTSSEPTLQPANGTRCWQQYQKFAAALHATGRPMVHSIKGPCGHPDKAGRQAQCSPFNASKVANLRRTSGDVHDNWASMLRVFNDAAAVANLSKPGYFADMDILEIGNGGLTAAEERAAFSVYCAVKSPLLLGNNLSNMSAATLATVGNELLIAVNQDQLGVAARRVVNTTVAQVWAGPLANGDVVAVLLNLAPTATSISVPLSQLELPTGTSAVAATDLWANATATFTGILTVASVESHGAAAFRLAAKIPVPL